MAMPATDGHLVDSGDARIFKQALSIPVMMQGLHDPARGAMAIAEGNGDIVMLARQMLADPDYARKVGARRPEAIQRCDRDNQCLRRLMLGLPIRCSVNPQMGGEASPGGMMAHISAIVQHAKERLMLRVTSSRIIMKMALYIMSRSQRG